MFLLSVESSTHAQSKVKVNLLIIRPILIRAILSKYNITFFFVYDKLGFVQVKNINEWTQEMLRFIGTAIKHTSLRYKNCYKII